MKVRIIKESDLPLLREIWKKHFQNEFDFPKFLDFNLQYIIENDEQEIITAGGIKLIAEAILVTDKDKGIFTRYRALRLAHDMNKYFCQETGHNQVHTFIQDPVYKELLTKHHGFTFTRGEALVCWTDDIKTDTEVKDNGEG